MRISRKTCCVLLAWSLLAGCGSNSIFFDHQPRELVPPGSAPGHALVLGLAYYNVGHAEWTQAFVTTVDDLPTLAMTKARTTVNFLLPPGKHRLNVKVLYGNALESELGDEPAVDADLADGQVYQVRERLATNIKGQSGVDVWIVHLGTIEQYETFLKNHPKHHKGELIESSELAAP